MYKFRSHFHLCDESVQKIANIFNDPIVMFISFIFALFKIIYIPGAHEILFGLMQS